MAYSVVVTGPHGSGKSCLIAAAIVHARRLVTLNQRLVRRYNQWPPDHRASQSPEEAEVNLTVRMETGADLWSTQERSRFDTTAHVDTLARHLWGRWLQSDFPPQPERAEDAAAAAPFKVTSVAPNLVGMEEIDDTSPEVTLIEVSGDLFNAFARSSVAPLSAVQLLATQRLRAALRQADAVVICLPCSDDWSASVRLGVRGMVRASQEVRGPKVMLALTKSDLILAERALARHVCTNPTEAISNDLAEQVLAADPKKQTLWRSLQSTSEILLQICSSYGLLRRSGTPNVDLVNWMPGSKPGRGRASVCPLWPEPSLDLSEIVPSAPATLRHWMPLGAIEAVFGAAAPAP
jgi:hypothetical protein